MNDVERAPLTASWAEPLEHVLECPSCHLRSVALSPAPACQRCGWAGRLNEDIPDFVDEGDLVDRNVKELEAQRNAVSKYYENEDKLACQWDRISSDELPPLLGSPRGVVLDLGCGTGTAGAAFRRAGARVIGADLSLPCLSVARRRLDAVVRVNAVRLPFADGVFDALVARGALHHFPDPDAALLEARRVAKPGARVLFADPREFAWLEPLKHRLRADDDSFTEDHHAYRREDYAALVARHFEVEEVRTVYPFGIVLAVGMDILPLPRLLPKRLVAEALFRIDKELDRTPLRAAGHLLIVTARKR